MFGFGQEQFHNAFWLNISVSVKSIKAALKSDYINPHYLSFADKELSEAISDRISRIHFLNVILDIEGITDPLDALTELFILKWLVTTGKARELEDMLAKDQLANPLMHYEDDVFETFLNQNYQEIKKFVDNEWSPFFRKIGFFLRSRYRRHVFDEGWFLNRRRDVKFYMGLQLRSAQHTWRLASFKSQNGEWFLDDGYFSGEAVQDR